MYRCVVCHFDTELDDVVVASGIGCICVRCYARETDTERHMGKRLRREIVAAMNGA